VIVAGEADAFLPARALEMAGHSTVPEGARLKVRISHGAEGPSGRRSPRGGHQYCSGDEQGWVVLRLVPPRHGQERRRNVSIRLNGTTSKRFGFVTQDRGGKDVFVHTTTLDRSGLSELPEGQRVRMQIGKGQKEPEALPRHRHADSTCLLWLAELSRR
jgi:CspA family cold shock protein